MTKQELELKLENLQKLLDEQNASANAYRDQIQALQKQLKDINKPKLSNDELNQLWDKLECVIDNFNFDDCDGYECDFEIDYDNKSIKFGLNLVKGIPDKDAAIINSVKPGDINTVIELVEFVVPLPVPALHMYT